MELLDKFSSFFPNLANSQLVAFVLALASSLFFTPLIRERAITFNLLDKPGGRHVHKSPVPRLGGVAIYLSLLITSLFFIALHGRYTPRGFEHFELVGILAGGTLIFLVGLLDDISPLPALYKLLVQIISAVVAWFCNVKVLYIVNPLFFLNLSSSRVLELDPLISFFVTVGWLVLITNALNLIDGLDGLAGGVALVVALSLWAILLDPKIMQPAGALLSATLAGATMGFLRSNYNPARIFLGDSGAYFLGFTLGANAVASLSVNPNTATVGSVVVLAFSFPLLETFFTITRRFLQNKPVMQPDAEHIHHKILKTGLSTKGTMMIIYASCILLGLIACTISGSHKRYAILVLMTLSLGFLSGFWRRGSGDKKAENIIPSKTNLKDNQENTINA
ncbi:MAG: MraY family glycosyltransferase [Candidatus Caenarcaniphilales bacterium]|nr:MraY family glycosyltransferase [Candidatus Caenarcaniphilales bacterium]